MVAAAQQAFCAEQRAYTGAPDDDGCDKRNFCKYATHMVQGGSSAKHDQLPTPAYVPSYVPSCPPPPWPLLPRSGPWLGCAR
jgi:hypothetical protein